MACKCGKQRTYNPFRIRTYEKSGCNSFRIRTYKNEGVGGSSSKWVAFDSNMAFAHTGCPANFQTPTNCTDVYLINVQQ